jgi:hypothetical protein
VDERAGKVGEALENLVKAHGLARSIAFDDVHEYVTKWGQQKK